jgi:hypothetical protein
MIMPKDELKESTSLSVWDPTYIIQPTTRNIGIGIIPPQLILDIQKKLDSLSQFGILIPNQEEVSNYLIEHQDLIDLLPLVAQITRKHIGDTPQLSIGICTDPEGGESHLSLYIRMQHYSDDIFNKINAIESEYIDKLPGKSGWIIVTTDFKSPE